MKKQTKQAPEQSAIIFFAKIPMGAIASGLGAVYNSVPPECLEQILSELSQATAPSTRKAKAKPGKKRAAKAKKKAPKGA